MEPSRPTVLCDLSLPRAAHSETLDGIGRSRQIVDHLFLLTRLAGETAPVRHVRGWLLLVGALAVHVVDEALTDFLASTIRWC
jgi:hypothetical protein